jgi:hypothetical protein
MDTANLPLCVKKYIAHRDPEALGNSQLLMGCRMEAESPVRACGWGMCRTCSEQPEHLPKKLCSRQPQKTSGLKQTQQVANGVF